MLIVPAVCATLFARGLRQQLVEGWSVGAAASVVGCGLSYAADLPTGAAIICTFGAFLLLTVGLRRRQRN